MLGSSILAQAKRFGLDVLHPLKSELDLRHEQQIENYFEDEVYRRVNFYEASDGHYLGESGVVTITLDEDEQEFSYSKSAQAEWSERKSGEILVPITDEEFAFLDTYVSGMSSSSWDGNNVDYKIDFILTDELEQMVKDLDEKFHNAMVEFEPETIGEIADDSHRYNTLQDEGHTMEFVIEDGQRHIKLFVECECYEYTDSDD